MRMVILWTFKKYNLLALMKQIKDLPSHHQKQTLVSMITLFFTNSKITLRSI